MEPPEDVVEELMLEAWSAQTVDGEMAVGRLTTTSYRGFSSLLARPDLQATRYSAGTERSLHSQGL